MTLDRQILTWLSKKINQDVTTPAGASVLMLDIESKVGIHLGLNTLKRLVGVLPSDGVTPRHTTLNIIANYLGFPDWAMFQEHISDGGSGFNRRNPFIEMSDLEEGTEIEICWRPDRRILIRHDCNGQYEVLESENGKLQAGDILSLSQLAIGFPFVAHKVFRDEKPLGCYQSATDTGIIRFNIIDGEL